MHYILTSLWVLLVANVIGLLIDWRQTLVIAANNTPGRNYYEADPITSRLFKLMGAWVEITPDGRERVHPFAWQVHVWAALSLVVLGALHYVSLAEPLLGLVSVAWFAGRINAIRRNKAIGIPIF